MVLGRVEVNRGPVVETSSLPVDSKNKLENAAQGTGESSESVSKLTSACSAQCNLRHVVYLWASVSSSGKEWFKQDTVTSEGGRGPASFLSPSFCVGPGPTLHHPCSHPPLSPQHPRSRHKPPLASLTSFNPCQHLLWSWLLDLHYPGQKPGLRIETPEGGQLWLSQLIHLQRLS